MSYYCKDCDLDEIHHAAVHGHFSDGGGGRRGSTRYSHSQSSYRPMERTRVSGGGGGGGSAAMPLLIAGGVGLLAYLLLKPKTAQASPSVGPAVPTTPINYFPPPAMPPSPPPPMPAPPPRPPPTTPKLYSYIVNYQRAGTGGITLIDIINLNNPNQPTSGAFDYLWKSYWQVAVANHLSQVSGKKVSPDEITIISVIPPSNK